MDPEHGWEKNKARTRLALATTAVRLFGERGYEQTTVEDIASAAGSSPRTFYRYFGAKEDVLFFNIRQVLDEFEECVSHPEPGLSRWEQIREGITVAVRRVAEPSQEVGEASIVSWLAEPAISRRFMEFATELEAIMAAALAEERGTPADQDLEAQLMARIATAVYMTAFHLHVESGDDLNDLLDAAFGLAEERLAVLPRGGA